MEEKTKANYPIFNQYYNTRPSRLAVGHEKEKKNFLLSEIKAVFFGTTPVKVSSTACSFSGLNFVDDYMAKHVKANLSTWFSHR